MLLDASFGRHQMSSSVSVSIERAFLGSYSWSSSPVELETKRSAVSGISFC